MTAGNANTKKCSTTGFLLCPAVGAASGLMIHTAAAHGASVGSSGGGTALLVFPAAAILFALFLVFTHRKKGWTVLVAGGAGYVGSALVPKLLQHGHRVVVLDLYSGGGEVFKAFQGYENLREIRGDFRDQATLDSALGGCDAVIHLAPITDRPIGDQNSSQIAARHSAAFKRLVQAAKSAGVKRFVLASSLSPIAEQSSIAKVMAPSAGVEFDAGGEFRKYEAQCEALLNEERAPGFITCMVRASRTVPNFEVDDLAAYFLVLLNQPDAIIDGKIFAADTDNLTIN